MKTIHVAAVFVALAMWRAGMSWGGEIVLSAIGKDAYVSLGTAPALVQAGTPFTVEGWMLVKTLQSRNTLFSRNVATRQNTGYSRICSINGNGATMSAYTGGAWVDVPLDQTLATDQWHHLAYSYDGHYMSFYLNGELVGRGFYSYNDNAAHEAQLGGYVSNSDPNGYLADVRLWNYARSGADIKELKNLRLQGSDAGLLGYWPLNDNNATVADLSGHGSSGTLKGTSTWVEDEALPALLPATADFVCALPFELRDIKTGNTRHTSSNKVEVVLTVPDGYTDVQLSESAASDGLSGSWQPLGGGTLTYTFAQPAAETNLVLYAWFTNTSSKVSLSRGFAQITYLEMPEVPTVLSFNGADNYVFIGKPAQLQMSGTAFTIEGWMYFNSFSARDMLYSKDLERKTTDYSHMLGFTGNGANMSAYTGNNGTPAKTWRELQLDNPLETERWYHVAYSYDGENLICYIDGEIQGSMPFAYGNVAGHEIKIGGYNSGSDIDGMMSDVRVWNRARGRAEIRDLMWRRLQGGDSGLLGYWTLNDGYRSEYVADRSGYGSEGRITNATWVVEPGLAAKLSGEVDFINALPLVVADANTGNTRFTGSTTVDVESFPVPNGYTHYMITDSGLSSSLVGGVWSSVDGLPGTLDFDLPAGDTNIAWYVWFTNTSQSVELRRAVAEIIYTDAHPAVTVRASLSRLVAFGGPLRFGVDDLVTASSMRDVFKLPVAIIRRQVHLVSGPEADATPNESYATIGEPGVYELEVIFENEAGNVTTSSVCEVTLTDAGTDPIVWAGGNGNDWHNYLNWNPKVVPPAGSPVVVNSGSITISSRSEPLASFTMNGGTLTFSGWETALDAEQMTIASGASLTHAVNSDTAAPWEPDARVYVICTNFTLNSGASINVNAKGFQTGCGPGTGKSGGGGWYGGGGYGGNGSVGGNGSTDGTDGKEYGSVTEPLWPGSGGGFSTAAQSGKGGGAVRIAALGKVVVNGSISANGGGDGGGTGAASGSGGGIYITCRTFEGTSGSITANGGSNNSAASGAGGGGRIAIAYDPVAQAVLAEQPSGVTFKASEGRGLYIGKSGSMWFADNSFYPRTTMVGGRIAIPGFSSWSVGALNISDGLAGFLQPVNITVTGDVALTDFGGLELTNSAVVIGGDLKVNNGADKIPVSYIYAGNASDFRVKGNLVLRRTTFGFYSRDGEAVRPKVDGNVVLNNATLNLNGASIWPAYMSVGHDMIITNTSYLQVYSASTNGTALQWGARVEVSNKLYVASNSWVRPISHGTGGGSASFRVYNLVIEGADSGFDADGRGFIGNRGYGTGTRGNGGWYGGGGYGGKGGIGNGSAGTGGKTYGSETVPSLPGSGGGFSGDMDRNGGGLIWIEAERQMTINGTIRANGLSITGTTGKGGGSGGGIYLSCQRLAGAGAVITAKGGDAQNTAGSGGGGRIAIWRVPRLQTADLDGWTLNVAAGNATYKGDPGTIYLGELRGPPGTTVIILR